ncbi:MAG: hypothetical protein ACR2H0_07485 [Candidatus Limnocylindrales bacterium]
MVLLRASGRYLDLVLLGTIVVLTLATAYIHYWVGGLMLMLNAFGYLTLAVAVTGSALFYRRALPLVLAALAAYAAVTILGWLVMGPYFDVAYIAKGIEIVLITLIAVWLWLTRAELRDSIGWVRSLIARAAAR